ncbi:MAG: flavoprotein [Patescibacteria group bacterium]|nr:flavoprotein [Patescibacteria group bacterium]
MRRPQILLGVTGSVAAKLTPKMVPALQQHGEVDVVATQAALYFWDRDRTGAELWTDEHEWPNKRYVKDQDIPHIQLGDQADILVVAPLTANTLTKIALGIANNLLTSLYYAWPQEKPVIVAPAMNTRMWNNPLTQQHLRALIGRHGNHCYVDPVAGRLACNTTGVGRMAQIDDITDVVRMFLP